MESFFDLRSVRSKAKKRHKFTNCIYFEDRQSYNTGMDGNGDNRVQDAAYERRLTLLYATQTGNAQDLAESLARRAIRQHFTTQCLSVEAYNPVHPRLEHQAYRRWISLTRIVLFLLLAPPETATILTR